MRRCKTLVRIVQQYQVGGTQILYCFYLVKLSFTYMYMKLFTLVSNIALSPSFSVFSQTHKVGVLCTDPYLEN